MLARNLLKGLELQRHKRNRARLPCAAVVFSTDRRWAVSVWSRIGTMRIADRD